MVVTSSALQAVPGAHGSPPPPSGVGVFSRSYTSSASTFRSRRAFERDLGASSARSAFSERDIGASGRENAPPPNSARDQWMIGASEREIAAVATGSGTDKITKAAVVESLREATRMLEPAMAANVQSAALSQCQPDAAGYCNREEVARVWLTNVLPALERAPLRTASGSLGTRRLTERLHKLLHGRLSQVMLDELPAAQHALGIAADSVGGGALRAEDVQPLVAHLTAVGSSLGTRRPLGCPPALL